MPALSQFNQFASGAAPNKANFFQLTGSNSAQIDVRMNLTLTQPQQNPLLLLALKPMLQYGGRNYGASGVPIGLSFGNLPPLKGPKYAWQSHAVLRDTIPITAVVTSTGTSLTFSVTLPNTTNPDAYQVSTYDVLEAPNGEQIWVTAMNYQTGVATVVRDFANTLQTNTVAEGALNNPQKTAVAIALAIGDNMYRVGRYWPEGSEIDFTKDVNVPTRTTDFNYTSIIRTPVAMSRTAKDSLYFAQQEDMRQLEITNLQHMLNMEAGAHFGLRGEAVDATGKTIRSGDGVVRKILRDSPATCAQLIGTGIGIQQYVEATVSTSISTMTFSTLNYWFANFLFKFLTTSQEKHVLCTLDMLGALHRLYPQSAFEKIDRDPIGDFGAIVTGLVTPYGRIRVVPDQLLTNRANRNPAANQVHAVGLNADEFNIGFFKDTTLQKDMQNPSMDGIGYGYLTEFTTALRAIETHALLVAIR
jgi:hypothetical protein